MAENFKVLIADNLDADGVEILKASGMIEVDYRKKTTKEELLEIIGQFDGLIIRSATKVNAEILAKADKLKVVIRAGVGVDNIDIPACSQKGVVVMNAPAGNSISTAEQAIALMFALARKTPQADASMKQKQWEKTKFNGTQLSGKIVGVIGLGRIGKEFVKRAKGLQMTVLGFDPFIPKENLSSLQIELTTLEDLLKRSDFISVHTPLSETTKGIVGIDNLGRLKDGVYLINAARGGIFDEAAIRAGIENGKIAGAGLDVFAQEPPPEDMPLYGLDEKVVLTPHLGASTDEAQLEVARETATSMVEYLRTGTARNSLNFPTLDAEEMDVLSDWFLLAEKIGSFSAQSYEGAVKQVEFEFSGDITNLNLTPLETAFSKGLLSVAMGSEMVNLVNAPVFMKERGISIVSSKKSGTEKENNMMRVILRGGEEEMSIRSTVNFSGGTVIGVNGMALEFRPEGNILLVRNKDVPKVVGEIGTILGDAGINIASLQLSRVARGGIALTVVEVDEEVPEEVLSTLRAKDFIVTARNIRL